MFRPQSRTDATEREYRKVAETIMRDFNETALEGESLDIWFSKRCADLKCSTIRRYLAALKFCSPDGKKLNIKKEIIYAKKNKLKPRTSARKRKSLPESIRLTLEERLWSRSCLYSKLASRWLFVGVLLGIRPGEGDSIKIKLISTGVHEFKIRNSKITNDRSTGPFRTITLYGLGDAELQKILEFIALVNIAKKRGLTWDRIYRRCRDRLSKENDALKIKGRKRITLYSARHQFAADLKAGGYGRVEIAASMGHGSDRTAGTHYGRRRVGEPRSVGLKSDEEECKRVRMHEDRVFGLINRGMNMGM